MIGFRYPAACCGVVHLAIKAFPFVFALLLFGSCTDRNKSAVPRELIGVWGLSEASAKILPLDCRSVRLQFTSDGHLITVSGQFKLIVKVSVTKQGEGFLVRQTVVEYNDKPNCQGKSAHFVMSNFIHEIYFERHDIVLRQYIWTKKSGRFVEFVPITAKQV